MQRRSEDNKIHFGWKTSMGEVMRIHFQGEEDLKCFPFTAVVTRDMNSVKNSSIASKSSFSAAWSIIEQQSSHFIYEPIFFCDLPWLWIKLFGAWNNLCIKANLTNPVDEIVLLRLPKWFSFHDGIMKTVLQVSWVKEPVQFYSLSFGAVCRTGLVKSWFWINDDSFGWYTQQACCKTIIHLNFTALPKIYTADIVVGLKISMPPDSALILEDSL